MSNVNATIHKDVNATIRNESDAKYRLNSGTGKYLEAIVSDVNDGILITHCKSEDESVKFIVKDYEVDNVAKIDVIVVKGNIDRIRNMIEREFKEFSSTIHWESSKA